MKQLIVKHIIVAARIMWLRWVGYTFIAQRMRIERCKRDTIWKYFRFCFFFFCVEGFTYFLSFGKCFHIQFLGPFFSGRSSKYAQEVWRWTFLFGKRFFFCSMSQMASFLWNKHTEKIMAINIAAQLNDKAIYRPLLDTLFAISNRNKHFRDKIV